MSRKALNFRRFIYRIVLSFHQPMIKVPWISEFRLKSLEYIVYESVCIFISPNQWFLGQFLIGMTKTVTRLILEYLIAERETLFSLWQRPEFLLNEGLNFLAAKARICIFWWLSLPNFGRLQPLFLVFSK